jgi:hypothetical protein
MTNSTDTLSQVPEHLTQPPTHQAHGHEQGADQSFADERTGLARPTEHSEHSARPTTVEPTPSQASEAGPGGIDDPVAAHSPPPTHVVSALRRPRLLPGLPVLHRTHDELQIGTDPRHAIVLSGIAEPLVTLLHTLDGRDTAAELSARAGPENRAALDQLLADLASLGLVEDAIPPEVSIDGAPAVGVPARLAADSSWWALRTAQGRVDAHARRHGAAMVIHGGGRVAASLATLLAAAGVGWIHSVAAGTVTPEEVGCGYLEEDVGLPRAAALRRAVLRGAPATNTAPLPRQRKPDLVLLADTVVPDPQLTNELFVAGAVQMQVWAGEGTGVVGPLIVPGRSCCLRCIDLHKADADQAWPTLATQLAGHAQPADLASAQASAAFAVTQALRVLDGPRIGGLPWRGIAELPVWGTAIEIDTFTGAISRTSWQPHPRCACGRNGGR